MFTCIDLFAGAGGLSYGLGQEGIESKVAVEIDNDFTKTFILNHKECHIINNDISNIKFDKLTKEQRIGKFDLVCGGPPCQGFSTVGSKNEKDRRNSLFWQFLRAVNEINPKIVLFENVSGFKKLYKGVAFNTLISELHKLGYQTKSEILDAADYGSPQHRKRTIVIGFKEGILFDFPKPTHSKEGNLFTQKYNVLSDAISDLPNLAPNETKQYYLKSKTVYQKEIRGDQQILTEHNCSNYGDQMKLKISMIPKNGSVKDLPPELRPKSCFGNTYARLNNNLPSPTITRNFGTPSSSRCIHPYQDRALSTREGARLQGFPDSYVFYGSKTSKNLQIGNAVPIHLAKAIGKELYISLKG
jgi:DNA (cytosine-5)-methyltransferase 1